VLELRDQGPGQSAATRRSRHFYGPVISNWINTDFDLGPSVTRTASASSEAPRKTFSRAAEWNETCLCGMRRSQNGDLVELKIVLARLPTLVLINRICLLYF
jgi:hypothetical protein